MTRRAKGSWRKLSVAAAAVVLLILAMRLLPVTQWLKTFVDWVSGLGPLGGILYAAVYVLAALLFVPGLVLTLGAGLAFGFSWGMVIVSAASTTAAALAFLIARHLARKSFERWASRNEKFAAIDRAIAKNGWKVVALLRLSPLIPFSVSNYLYGLTAVRFLPYLAASWVAMLPATFLYVSLGAAGRSLGQGRVESSWEWVLLCVGVAAAIVVTVILTRVAREELRKAHVAGEDRDRSSPR